MIKKLALLLCGCMSIYLCCCGPKHTAIVEHAEQIEISFSWWGKDARNEYTLDAIKQFEELHPHIKVICKYSDSSGYQTRYNIQMVSNTEADVMQINYAWLEEYSHDGSGFYDLSTLQDYIDFSSFSEETLNYGMMNGKLNAIPIALNTMTIYINETIYKQHGLAVPTSWDDFFAAAEAMNGTCYPLSLNSKSLWFAAASYAGQQTGHHIMAQDGTIGFDAADVQIMLEFYRDMVNKQVIPQVEYFNKLNLESGDYAGTMQWLSDADYMQSAIDSGYQFVIMDYPAAASDWYSKPATMYAISKNTEYPKESAMLLDYLLNSEEMAEKQGIEKGIPISSRARTYLEDHSMLNGIKYDAFLKMEEHLEDMSVISFYFENATVIDLFIESCNTVLYEKNSANDEAQKFLDALAETIAESQN